MNEIKCHKRPKIEELRRRKPIHPSQYWREQIAKPNGITELF
jgi:hypothetical protein